MRHLRTLTIAAIALPIAFLTAYAQADFHDRARQAVEKTNDDLERFVHRDNLDREQRERFDVAMRELHNFREAAREGRWEGGREHLDRAIENIEAVAEHARIGDHEREALHEDIRHLREVRDGWR
jgi:hypothetical protein